MNPGQGLGGLLVLLVSCGCPCAPAVTPVLYSQPAYQSPVRGDPDDLLLLPGYGLGAGDTVVYEAISDTTQAPAQPCCIPSSSTEFQGIADLVSSADAPSSLAVRLPNAMKPGQSYALWVADSSGNWSAPVLINDARPLWITPDCATLHPAISWRSTLYGNTCNAVDLPVSDFGMGTVRYCPAGSDATCECRSISSVDVGVTADSSDKAPVAGGVVTFAVTVINHDESNSATAATLFIEPSAGVQIQSLSPSTGSCDASINVCTLGILPAGQSATVSVTASLMSSGAWPVTFSVTHSDADAVPQNDSTEFIEQVRAGQSRCEPKLKSRPGGRGFP
jgi:hypothetical protein